MSIFRAPQESAELQKKFQGAMMNMSVDQVYQLANSDIDEDTKFSIHGNRAVYLAYDNRVKVIDIEKMEIEQSI